MFVPLDIDPDPRRSLVSGRRQRALGLRHRYVSGTLDLVLDRLPTLACTGISRLQFSPVFRILSLL